jgi:molybdate transport system substrate-binding protein
MRTIASLILALVLAGAAQAADIRVMESGAFAAPFAALVPGFERTTGDHIVTIPGPSMGATPQAIPNRLARGEAADVVILARSSLDDLVAKGKVAPGSQTDLVRSKIAMAVKAGAPKPDISTVDALRKALLAAKSVAYSDSASGVYIKTQLFKTLGIEAEMKAKSRMIPADPVGAVVAKGEAEIGFQQLSELKPVPGIDIVGMIPDAVQSVTVFSAGVASGAKEPTKARALISYLASRGVNATVVAAGLEPINP